MPVSRDVASRQPLILLGGILLLVGVAVAGRGDLLGRVLEPPFWAALPLAVASALVGLVLVGRAADRLSASAGDPRSLIRGVRLVFLAVAAFAAAAGWLLGSAMPVVVGLVIAAVDVIETTALLLVTRARDPDQRFTSGAGCPGSAAAGSGAMGGDNSVAAGSARSDATGRS